MNEACKLKAVAPLKQMARNQLGTVGRGSHYIDLFTDEEHRVDRCSLWLSWFRTDGMGVEPCMLSTASELGVDHLEAIRLGRFFHRLRRSLIPL